MREFFRPYSIVTRLDDTNVSGISLTDSAGTGLRSNYVSVEASGQGVGFFSVTLSSINTLQTRERTIPPASGLLGATSGLIGGIAPVNKGVVEFVLSDKDRVNTVFLSLSHRENTIFMITYGEVQTGNPLRDQERPIGD